MNDYARPMPYLGFDPAPGDVVLTRGLAQGYSGVAQELQQIITQIEQVDLSPWLGQTGSALQALQATFRPALQGTAAAVHEMESSVSSWAGQLSGFQAEADALERKAANASADQHALHGQLAAAPSTSPALKRELESASTTLSTAKAEAQRLHEDYLAAAEKATRSGLTPRELWEKTEPVRSVLELALAPLDMFAAHQWLHWLRRVAGVPEQWLKEVDDSLVGIEKIMQAGESAASEILSTAELIARTGSKTDAWYAFAPRWLRGAAGSLSQLDSLSYVLSGLGLTADASTMISPQDSGGLGWADRGVAGVNGALITADLALAEFPVVGEVAMFATGAYLAGDYLYHHWTPFRNVANDVGHATVHAADYVSSQVVGSVESDVQIAKDVGHKAGSLWHSVTSSIGSWF